MSASSHLGSWKLRPATLSSMFARRPSFSALHGVTGSRGCKPTQGTRVYASYAVRANEWGDRRWLAYARCDTCLKDATHTQVACAAEAGKRGDDSESSACSTPGYPLDPQKHFTALCEDELASDSDGVLLCPFSRWSSASSSMQAGSAVLTSRKRGRSFGPHAAAEQLHTYAVGTLRLLGFVL